MYAVIRTYSGGGAIELFQLLTERKDELENLLRPINGFVSYTLLRTDDGGATVTVCEDKSGTDESVQIARSWIQDNAPNLDANPPSILEGSVALYVV
jgi:hypothetical protein